MFCVNCGNEIDEGAKFCSNCGHAVGNTNENIEDNSNNVVNEPISENDVSEENLANNNIDNSDNNNNNVKSVSNDYDKTSKGLATGALLLPPFGLAYYFMSKKDFPNKAHGALEASIFGIVTYTVAALLFVFVVLPIEKQYIIKYECEKSTPGAVYYNDTHICKKPDGSEYKKFYK